MAAKSPPKGIEATETLMRSGPSFYSTLISEKINVQLHNSPFLQTLILHVEMNYSSNRVDLITFPGANGKRDSKSTYDTLLNDQLASIELITRPLVSL